ncbi:DUF7556 family protein [Halorientalis litorea]|jgi:hypothetical protein|uniref:DUF7556 family protein n=1 Tax=Halorientalis litorea TaxID=2931977 RepID=UPI001FF4C714|nr:hypothetical protein [Halorientalis litorea]
MAPDVAATDSAVGCEAMSSVDSDQFIIADTCRDDAWVSTPVESATALSEWR